MKKDKKLYSIFMIAIITILGYLIYSNYQLQQKVSNLEKDIPKIEDRLSQQNIQFEDVNEKVSNMMEKECYKIECKNATTRKVCWIEKETGLGVMSISYNKINGIEYESELSKKEVVFGTVTDEDLIEPDMSQYTIQE